MAQTALWGTISNLGATHRHIEVQPIGNSTLKVRMAELQIENAIQKWASFTPAPI